MHNDEISNFFIDFLGIHEWNFIKFSLRTTFDTQK